MVPIVLTRLQNLISIWPRKEQVSFTPFSEGFSSTPPLPMKKVILEYFKKCPRDFEGGPNRYTYKVCPSFLDAMTVGYVIRCPCDVYIKTYETHFDYELPADVPNMVVSSHNGQQTQAFEEGSILDEDKFYSYMLKINPGYFIKNSDRVGWQVLPFYYDKENRKNFEAAYGYTDNLLLERNGILPVNLFVRRREGSNTFIIEKGTPICTIIPYVYTDFYASINKPDPARWDSIENTGLQTKHRGQFFANSIKNHRVNKRYL
jgi:hypothetical protein